jgi:EAL domain-containing protein (putative c-di-GMP-specific phosphodiesterase class I)
MSVNISASQFQDAALLDDVQDALDMSGLPAGWLKLEITETVAMKAGEATVDILQALKALGVRSVISIATSLDLSITAEGVETIDQLSALRALACDEGQGYFFSQPVPEDAVGPLLARDKLGLERRAAA